MKRWSALIIYNDGSGETHSFDEFHEFGEVIEKGPNWNSIDKIHIAKEKGPRNEIPSSNPEST